MRLLVSLACLAMLAPPFFGDSFDTGARYEGSPCRMEDGRPGICQKVTDCPLRMYEIQEGLRGADSAGRCGFDGITEIACCPGNHSNARMRLADRGCWTTLIAMQDTRCAQGELSDLFDIVAHGMLVELPEFPYVAALGYRNDKGEIEYTCAGTLITEFHVLTAAHCVHNIQNRAPVEVRLGDLSLEHETSNTQRIPIMKFVWHEKYSKYRYYHDLAVITLERMAIFFERVQPICLSTDFTWMLQSRYIPGEVTGPSLLVIGWGSTEINGPLSPNLMKSSSLSLIDRAVCSGMYQNAAGLPRGITPELLCAVDRNTSRRSDACRGDSGGPLIRRTAKGDVIFGITAFGQGCGSSVPGIYTAVYPYIDWIEKQVFGPSMIDIRFCECGSEGRNKVMEVSTAAKSDTPTESVKSDDNSS